MLRSSTNGHSHSSSHLSHAVTTGSNPYFSDHITDIMDSVNDSSFGASQSHGLNASNTSASSSKAVLAALRALQDKIRRLEQERGAALDEAAQLRHQLQTQVRSF